MDKNEKKLSEYIDKLNAEKMPDEHECLPDSPELEELMDTVRKIRSLKEPALPDADYPKKLARVVSAQLSQKSAAAKKKMDMAGRSGCCCGSCCPGFCTEFCTVFRQNRHCIRHGAGI